MTSSNVNKQTKPTVKETFKELTKIVDDNNPNAGDTVIFTISVYNDGPNTATDIDVFDYLPSG